jgi:hypothetical protein
MTSTLPDHPTDLTPEQRKYLNGLRGFVAAPPTVAELHRKNLPRTIILVVIFGGIATAAWMYEVHWAGWFSGGILTGLLLAMSGNIVRAARLWPATAAVVDWERLNRLVGEHDVSRESP